MTRILTKLALGFSLATGLIVAAPAASAEVHSSMTVTVPFAFTANNVAFPAGTYAMRTSDHYLTMRNTQTNQASVVMVHSDQRDANHGPSRLTFNRRSGQTYLTQVWTDGSSVHSELISYPKPIREIGQVALPDTTLEIATK